jgi:hypothetical protein
VVVLLLAVTGFYIWRRKKAAKAQHADKAAEAGMADGAFNQQQPLYQQQPAYPGQEQPQGIPGAASPAYGPPQPGGDDFNGPKSGQTNRYTQQYPQQ